MTRLTEIKAMPEWQGPQAPPRLALIGVEIIEIGDRCRDTCQRWGRRRELAILRVRLITRVHVSLVSRIAPWALDTSRN